MTKRRPRIKAGRNLVGLLRALTVLRSSGIACNLFLHGGLHISPSGGCPQFADKPIRLSLIVRIVSMILPDFSSLHLLNTH